MGVRELQGRPGQNSAKLGDTVLVTEGSIQNRDLGRKRCCNSISNTEVMEKYCVAGQSLRMRAGGERRLDSWESLVP